MAALKLAIIAKKMEAFVLILMLVLLPLVHSSSFEHTSMATQDFEAKDGDSSTNFTNVVVEDSAREVPTGPDPLHHNDNPTGP